jgi:hypothetical protein
MAHVAKETALNTSYFVTGTPGIGLQTLSEKLNGFYTDMIGFREDHERPYEWFISKEVLWFKSTDPDGKDKVFVGYGQNHTELFALPWRRVVVLKIEEEELRIRALQYRRSEQLPESEDDEAVSMLFKTQKDLLRDAEASGYGSSILDISNISIDETIEAIRGLMTVDGDVPTSEIPVDWEVVLHPKRQRDSQERWINAYKALMLVDGIVATDLHQEIVDFILNYLKSPDNAGVTRLTVHGTTGVHDGRDFDNRESPQHLFSHDGQTVMLASSISSGIFNTTNDSKDESAAEGLTRIMTDELKQAALNGDLEAQKKWVAEEMMEFFEAHTTSGAHSPDAVSEAVDVIGCAYKFNLSLHECISSFDAFYEHLSANGEYVIKLVTKTLARVDRNASYNQLNERQRRKGREGFNPVKMERVFRLWAGAFNGMDAKS